MFGPRPVWTVVLPLPFESTRPDDDLLAQSKPASRASGGVETRLQMAAIARKMALSETDAAADPIYIGRFVVLDRVGKGGMGTVYHAYDPDLDRSVALKVLRRELTEADDLATERMAQEARALAQLNHPNVVTIHEVGMAQDQRFVAMELVEGRDLRAWTEEAPRVVSHRLAAALPLLLQAGRGLAAAHAVGIVHRDFKPANVLIGSDGRVRVADFGLASPATPVSSHGPRSDQRRTIPDLPSSGSTPKLTEAGTRLGTPAYMAPEQRRGDVLDARADQFSYCLSAWEVVFGQRPRAAIDGPPPIPAKVGGHERWIARVLRRGMASRPDGRYPSMDALLADLSRNPARTRRRRRIAAAVVIAMAGGIGGFALQRAHRCDDAADDLAPVWNESRRSTIAAAFADTQLPMAADGWQRLQTQTDTYADAWSQLATQQCRAARIDATLPAAEHRVQQSCLDARLARVDAMLDVFEHPDRDRVFGAASAVGSLPPLQTCLDPRQTAHHDPAHAHSSRALAYERGLVDVGRVAEARPGLEALIAQAQADGTPFIEASARVTLGLALERLDEPDAAARSYERAYWLALEHGDDLTAAAASRSLVGLSASHGHIAEAEAWAPYAQLLTRRAGSGPDERSSLASSMAQLAIESGDRAAAEPHAREALALAIEAWGPGHPRLAAAQQNLAIILRFGGKLEESLTLTQQAHRIRTAALGPRHPDTARTAENVGASLGQLHRHEEALQYFEEALDIYSITFGRTNANAARMLSSIGVSLDQLGDDPAAQTYYAEAHEILRTTLPPGDARLLTAQMHLAMATMSNGRCDHAVPMLRDTLQQLRRSAPGNPRVAIARSVLGACLVAQDRWVEAEVELSIAAASLEPNPAGHASTVGWLARARLAGNDPAGALALTDLALARIAPLPNTEGVESEVGLVRARALAQLGRHDQAAAQSEAAMDAARTVSAGRPGLVEHLAERAELLLSIGRPAAALAPATEGVELIERNHWEATIAPPIGGRIHLALARALASSLPAVSREHASTAGGWFRRTDATFDPQRRSIEQLLTTDPQG
ncbi:MAG: tetratricopeptide repeat protein [Deltaproteobacteria bacterium]|nr:tetratricopeptide repeat protein [Deltaproteobacteria bacterium]